MPLRLAVFAGLSGTVPNQRRQVQLHEAVRRASSAPQVAGGGGAGGAAGQGATRGGERRALAGEAAVTLNPDAPRCVVWVPTLLRTCHASVRGKASDAVLSWGVWFMFL